MEQWEINGIKHAYSCLSCVLIIIFFIVVGFFIGRSSVYTNPPVEEIMKADSLIKVNDSIKIVINNLDSIKDAKIIEVKTLDNDSTLKLFYKLIKE